MQTLTLDLGNNATVSAPAGWLNSTSVNSTDIIDLYARAYLLNGTFAWVVELYLQGAGSYANYNVALTTPSNLTLSELSVPVNVTIPFTSQPANTTLECIAWVEGRWSTACEVLEIRSNSAVVSTANLVPVSLRVVSKVTESPPPVPSTTVVDSSSDCDLNPTPLSLACAFFLLGVAGLGLLLIRGKEKPASSLENLQDNSHQEQSAVEHELKEEHSVNLPKDETAVERPASASGTGFFHFHLLFGLIYQAQGRLRKLWTMLSVIEVETLVLGLCYSFWEDNSNGDGTAEDVFASYAGQDLAYVAIALSIGGVYCVGLQALRMHPAPSAVIGVMALGGSIYLNVEECCYSEGGRWGEGLLWTVLLQLLVLETIKALLMLLWTRRRVLSS